MTVFLVMVLVGTVVMMPLLRKEHLAEVEVVSRNALVSGRQEVAYFRSISQDSVFTGLTITKDSVRTSPPVHLTATELKRVMEKTINRLSQRAKTLSGSLKEMEYYLEVHGVQDEGYNTVAQHDETIKQELNECQKLLEALKKASLRDNLNIIRSTVKIHEATFKPTSVAVECMGGRWAYGRWSKFPHQGPVITTDHRGRTVCALMQADTIFSGRKTDSGGTYIGQMNRWAQAEGHGRNITDNDTYFEGLWQGDRRNGFGFDLTSHKLRAGEWKNDKYMGERISYTSERIYGIDISKYQHGKGRKFYPIQWNRLRIIHLGKVGNKSVKGTVNYPISFIYIKSTEGTTVRNPYFKADYRQARRHGFRTGAYHFFSIRSSAIAQANYFLRQSSFNRGDMPPVLDLEPTDEQIKKLGGPSVMFSHVRTWMNIVARRTGVRPVLYVSQRFVNKYLSLAPDIKRNYNVWIARYGMYKPDVRLVYWQLCPDGTVAGIKGDVDINVFNGYQDNFNEFISTETVR